jgi:hypothetical protein
MSRRSTLIVLLTVLLGLNHVVSAATVRGRLVRMSNRAPVVGVAVTLYSQTRGRSNAVYSGPDGMYYMNATQGTYYLEIWVSRDPRVRPLVYTIQVSEPYTDIAEIPLQ